MVAPIVLQYAHIRVCESGVQILNACDVSPGKFGEQVLI